MRQVCNLLVAALVDLHAVDYSAAGLGDFGKPVGYIERPVPGWSKRYVASTKEVAVTMPFRDDRLLIDLLMSTLTTL